MLVDLAKTDPRTLRKYLGKAGTDRFLAEHSESCASD